MNLPVKSVARSKKAPLPRLRDGERLDAEEFHRRYLNMPDERAELIDGIVHMSSPVSLDHGEPHALMVIALGTYAVQTKGIKITDNTSLRSNRRNEVQPDVMLFIEPERGGGIQLGRPLKGVPELLAEICYTTKKNDLKKKFKSYAAAGVREYLVWRVEDDEIDWFDLVDGNYQRMLPDSDEIVRSTVFPGLRIATEALANQEMTKVLAVLQQGLQGPEHADFVKRLSETSDGSNPS